MVYNEIVRSAINKSLARYPLQPLVVAFPPYHSDWWLMGFDLVPFVEKIIVSKIDFERRRKQKNLDTYHYKIWERMEGLKKYGLLEVYDFLLDEEELNRDANRILNKISGNENTLNNFVSDLIKAYNDWLTYNMFKIRILNPLDDAEYLEQLLENYHLWLDDLRALRRYGLEAFNRRPELYEKTAHMEIVSALKIQKTFHLLKEKGESVAVASSMQEYSYFLPYLSILDDEQKPSTRMTEIQQIDDVLKLVSPNDLHTTSFYSSVKATFSGFSLPLTGPGGSNPFQLEVEKFLHLAARLWELFSSLRQLYREHLLLRFKVETSPYDESELRADFKSIVHIHSDIEKLKRKTRRELVKMQIDFADTKSQFNRDSSVVDEILERGGVLAREIVDFIGIFYTGFSAISYVLDKLDTHRNAVAALVTITNALRKNIPLSPTGIKFIASQVRAFPSIQHAIERNNTYAFWRQKKLPQNS